MATPSRAAMAAMKVENSPPAAPETPAPYDGFSKYHAGQPHAIMGAADPMIADFPNIQLANNLEIYNSMSPAEREAVRHIDPKTLPPSVATLRDTINVFDVLEKSGEPAGIIAAVTKTPDGKTHAGIMVVQRGKDGKMYAAAYPGPQEGDFSCAGWTNTPFAKEMVERVNGAPVDKLLGPGETLNVRGQTLLGPWPDAVPIGRDGHGGYVSMAPASASPAPSGDKVSLGPSMDSLSGFAVPPASAPASAFTATAKVEMPKAKPLAMNM